MSGETEKNVSGWTVDTLRDHVIALINENAARARDADAAAELRNEQRFNAQQQAIKDALTSQKEAVAAALVAAEKAVLVAEQNAEKWRGAANEWRGAMNDRERNLMPRSEAEQRLQAISELLTAGLKANSDKIDATNKANLDKFAAFSGALDRNAGRREGLMLIFAIITAVSVIFSIYMALRKP